MQKLLKYFFSSLCFLIALPLLCITPKTNSTITIDGEELLVYFNDGDTFKILEGANKSSSVRIAGLNSLETYGPVHAWGKNTSNYLFDNSTKATVTAQRGSWHCKLEPGKDTYGRLLATCDDLAFALLSEGLAHAYSIDNKPAKRSYLTRQKSAQKRKAGMWKGGTPESGFIITSLHSADEGVNSYNRLISAEDGRTKKWGHDESYGVCENVCLEDGTSCMIYVPFGQRYGKNKPECLYKKKS